MWDGVCNPESHASKVTIQRYRLCFRKVPMSLLEVSEAYVKFTALVLEKKHVVLQPESRLLTFFGVLSVA